MRLDDARPLATIAGSHQICSSAFTKTSPNVNASELDDSLRVGTRANVIQLAVIETRISAVQVPIKKSRMVMIRIATATSASSNQPDFAMKTAVGLAVLFMLLSCLSLLAFSRLVPWMRDNLTFFDVASEGNLWTWGNVAVLVSASNAHLACALFYRQRERANFLGWLASAIILLTLSLDDLVSLHERLENIGRLAGGGYGLLHLPGSFQGQLLPFLSVSFSSP